MRTRFQRLYPPVVPQEGPAHWLLFSGDDLLLAADGPLGLLAGTTQRPIHAEVHEPQLLGIFDDLPVMFGMLAPDVPPPADLRTVGLRAVLAEADAELCSLSSYAAQLLRWARTSRFCSACAQPLEPLDGWGKRCPSCGHSLYPPVSPAAIVLIHDGADQVLLASKDGWGKRYSLIAGFVEPGETLEQCVAREVHEEVGVMVDEIRYVGSQPWPFPHQLMLGFTARYAGGEIAVDLSELSDARWFSRNALPDLPPPFSIARQIIEQWRSEQA